MIAVRTISLAPYYDATRRDNAGCRVQFWRHGQFQSAIAKTRLASDVPFAL